MYHGDTKLSVNLFHYQNFLIFFIESNYKSDPQLTAIREMIYEKDPNTHAKFYAMNR